MQNTESLQEKRSRQQETNGGQEFLRSKEQAGYDVKKFSRFRIIFNVYTGTGIFLSQVTEGFINKKHKTESALFPNKVEIKFTFPTALESGYVVVQCTYML